MGQAIGTSSVATEPAISGSNSVAGGTAGQFNGNVFIQGGNLLAEGTAPAGQAVIAGVSSSGGAAVAGVSTTSQGFGVSGINDAAGIAVSGSSSKGHGVKGANGAGSGITLAPASCGVWGDSDGGIGVFGTSNGRHGVYGESTNSSGFGVSGTNNSAGLCTAVLGSSENGHGVKGANVGAGGKGSGTTPPKAGCGVWGDSDQGFGVFGASAHSDGVHGEVTDAFACGVSGTNHSAGPLPCIAVQGSSDIGHGVKGISLGAGGGSGTTPNVGCGVWGDAAEGIGVYGASRSGTAGQFQGNVKVTGNISVTGDINVTGDVILLNAGADCAEQFDLKAEESADPGTVMVIDDTGALRTSDRSYDRAVAGVVSGAGAFRPAIVLDRHANTEARTIIALVGKVYCKVDANACAIAVGDLLTTSDTPGHAMKVLDPSRGFGAVIGKALGSLNTGFGLLPILIALQ